MHLFGFEFLFYFLKLSLRNGFSTQENQAKIELKLINQKIGFSCNALQRVVKLYSPYKKNN